MIAIAGIGVDIVRIERIKRAVERWGEAFLNRVFTKNEQDYSKGHYSHLAGRFGAKEAFLKAIGTGWGKGIKWTDIEVIKDNRGRPEIKVRGRLKDTILKKGVLVSISHEKDYAIAQVVIVSETER